MNELRISGRRVEGQHGLTLVELLVTMTVAGTLLALAAPTLGGVGQQARLSAVAADLFAQLHLARSEAVKRGRKVTICKSASGTVCHASGGWHQGWIVFEDADGNGLRSPTEPLIHRGVQLPLDLRVTGNQNVARYITFSPSGGTRTAGGALQAGTLTVCRPGAGPAVARQIVISAAGRARIQRTTLPACT